MAGLARRLGSGTLQSVLFIALLLSVAYEEAGRQLVGARDTYARAGVPDSALKSDINAFVVGLIVLSVGNIATYNCVYGGKVLQRLRRSLVNVECIDCSILLPMLCLAEPRACG
jgi:hypothetical protein